MCSEAAVGERPRHPSQLAIKRALDVLTCGLLLLLLAPVLAVLYVFIKLASPGPALFVQDRVGLGERVYRMYKFRTMAVRAGPASLQWSKAEEDRIIPGGRFLRDFGLDELPQLFNILKGDMSVIGPRPPLPARLAEYTPVQRLAFRMRPGVLSLAAVMGRRSLPMARRLDYHAEYVEKWNLGLDAWILWRSLFVVLGREAATEQAG